MLGETCLSVNPILIKAACIQSLKLVGLAIVLMCWRLVAQHTFPIFCSLTFTCGTVALVPLLVLSGRRLLDRRPNAERAALLTIPIHYLEMFLLGCAMLVFCLLFFVGALRLQSLHAILWTILWFSPAWIFYVRLYEERELELRFGRAYLNYKAREPFFF